MNNKTKTILFASLIATIILPLSSSNVFAEDQKTIEEKQKIAKYIQDLEKLRQKALQNNKIPDSELTDRYGEKWESQYTSASKFTENFDAIKQYSQYQHQQNGWNEKMVKTHNAIYNFDTIIEKDGFGHEIVSLVVAKQKLQNQYSPTEPVEKFHEWVISKYTTPETVEEIDSRLLEIIGHNNFLRFSDEVLLHFNTLAEHGNVPESLFEQDSKYWNIIVNISMCQYSKNCDLDSLKDILENRSYERDASETPEIASNWLSLFLPNAYAWSQAYHYSIIYGEPWTCTYGNCKQSADVPWSIGEHDSTARPPDTSSSEGIGHGTSNYMDFRVSTCSNQDAYNVVHAIVTIGSSVEHNSYNFGWGCAVIDTTIEASDRPNPWYVWYVNGITNSWQP